MELYLLWNMRLKISQKIYLGIFMDLNIIKDNHEYTTQYRCYLELEPMKVIKVNLDYFENTFEE